MARLGQLEIVSVQEPTSGESRCRLTAGKNAIAA
jgi:hypothetical protein